MLSTSIVSGTNIVTVRYGGALRTEDVEEAQGNLRFVIGEQGSARLLVEYGDIEPGRMEPRAVWEDLKNARLLSDVDRVAMVADQGWLERLGDLTDLVTPLEVETFRPDRRDEALAWLRG